METPPPRPRQISTLWKNFSTVENGAIAAAALLPTLTTLTHPAAAQLGPWPIRTKQATFEASIHRREKDILGIERKTSDGTRAPQVGLAIADIVEIRMPTPALFTNVEKILTMTNPTPSFQRTSRPTNSSSKPNPPRHPGIPPAKPSSSSNFDLQGQ